MSSYFNFAAYDDVDTTFNDNVVFLALIAKSLDRKIDEPNVAELIEGTRETYLRKTSLYAARVGALCVARSSSLFHKRTEYARRNSLGGTLERRIYVRTIRFIRKILDTDESVFGDFKITGSFKIMRTLGICKQKIPTCEVYKTGLKKGQPKFKTESRYDDVRSLLDQAIQLNAELISPFISLR